MTKNPNNDINTHKYDFSEVIATLEKHQNILIVGHVSPDADTLGSALTMLQALESLGKEVQVAYQDEVPPNLMFLPRITEVKKPADVVGEPDLVLLVDCASVSRVGEGWLEPYLEKAELVVIDHHAVGDLTDIVAFVAPERGACCEIIFLLLREMNLEITTDMARCLYAGITTDTGGFRFTNTKKMTFQIAAELIDCGVKLEEMRVNLFETRSMAHMKLRAFALSNVYQTGDQRLVWSYLTQEIKDEVGATKADTDNISGLMMHPEGVRVGLFFDERAAEGVVKLSARGRDGYNVAALAAQFGGGGHYAASGATIEGTLDEVMEKVIAAAIEMLANMQA